MLGEVILNLLASFDNDKVLYEFIRRVYDYKPEDWSSVTGGQLINGTRICTFIPKDPHHCVGLAYRGDHNTVTIRSQFQLHEVFWTYKGLTAWILGRKMKSNAAKWAAKYTPKDDHKELTEKARRHQAMEKFIYGDNHVQ